MQIFAFIHFLPATITVLTAYGTWATHPKYYYENPFSAFFLLSIKDEKKMKKHPFFLQRHCSKFSKSKFTCLNTQSLALGGAQTKASLLCALCACIWFSDQTVLYAPTYTKNSHLNFILKLYLGALCPSTQFLSQNTYRISVTFALSKCFKSFVNIFDKNHQKYEARFSIWFSV